MIRSLYSGKVSRHKTSLTSCWMLRLSMCSTKISCLTWNFMAASWLRSESAWLFSDLGTHLKPHRQILDFKMRMSYRYPTIWEYLVTIHRWSGWLPMRNRTKLWAPWPRVWWLLGAPPLSFIVRSRESEGEGLLNDKFFWSCEDNPDACPLTIWSSVHIQDPPF